MDHETYFSPFLPAGDHDVGLVAWGGGVLQQYAAACFMKYITSDLQAIGWGDSFGKAGLDLYSYNGHPWDMGAVGFWYNKDLFAKAGVTQISDPEALARELFG